jgi:penicillin amidase
MIMARRATRQEQAEAVLSVLRGESTAEEVCARRGITSATYRRWQRSVLTRRHSDTDATVTSAALRGSAHIVRDTWGVAHCYGDSVHDLGFAAGIAQAQDRLWQLDYRKRLADGRLAEILGAERLRTDREHRTLGFRRIAQDVELPALSQEAGAALEGFAAGVNAWTERVAGNWPIEFDLLGHEPEPWAPADSLAILRYFWWTLTGRLSQLVACERLTRGAPPEVAEWFLTPETISYIAPDWQGGGGGTPGGAAEADSPADVPGSNNWVAGPSRTTHGAAVLAADPHWPVAFPDMWYEQHLSGAGCDVVGAAYPGAPWVVFGRTAGMAWGRTNNVTSVRDLYHEQIDPADGERYRTVDGWERFDTTSERIDVAGGDAVVEEVRRTQSGRPVVNGFIPAVEESGDGPITLRWLGQEVIADVQAMIDLSRAQSVAEARQAFAGWRLSLWNAVIADTQGHFAYQMCGSPPERPVATRGTRPGGDGQHEWTGYRPTASLPGEDDPARGWVGSANNPPAPPECMGGLYGTYADGYRHDRIARALGQGEPLTPDAVADLQDDNLSVRAEELAVPLARLLTGSPRRTRAATWLRRWDHRFDADQVGATIWSALWPRFVRRIGQAVLTPHVAQLNAANAGRLARHLLLGTGPGFFAGDVGQIAGAACDEALDYLERALGKTARSWKWGAAQRLVLHHPAAITDAAREVLDPPAVPCAGGNGVVNNRSGSEGPDGFEVTGGPSYRLVADMARSDARGVLLAGQSAQPGHPHYQDQLALWPAGKTHPLLLDADAIGAAAVATTRLARG